MVLQTICYVRSMQQSTLKRCHEFVGDLCKDNSRQYKIPVVLFKILLIQHIYGIRSLRRTLEEVGTEYSVSVVYWLSAERAGSTLFNGEL